MFLDAGPGDGSFPWWVFLMMPLMMLGMGLMMWFMMRMMMGMGSHGPSHGSDDSPAAVRGEEVADSDVASLRQQLAELQQRLAEAGIEILGLGGQIEPGSKGASLRGQAEQFYLLASALTVAAGTSEIMRNIIAMRGLGLPRG